jgi:hypothetical protein
MGKVRKRPHVLRAVLPGVATLQDEAEEVPHTLEAMEEEIAAEADAAQTEATRGAILQRHKVTSREPHSC